MLFVLFCLFVIYMMIVAGQRPLFWLMVGGAAGYFFGKQSKQSTDGNSIDELTEVIKTLRKTINDAKP